MRCDSVLLEYLQFQNLIYHFPEQSTDHGIRLRSSRFIFEKIGFTAALQRSAICYIFHLS